jgi:hypothetical protein
MHWPGHRFALSLFAGILAAWLIAMFILMRQSALPAEASGTMLVVFEPGTPAEQAFAAIINAGARPIRETAFGFIWVVNGNQSGLAGNLRSHGALGSYRELPINPTIAGCVAIADAKVANAFGLQ